MCHHAHIFSGLSQQSLLLEGDTFILMHMTTCRRITAIIFDLQFTNAVAHCSLSNVVNGHTSFSRLSGTKSQSTEWTARPS